MRRTTVSKINGRRDCRLPKAGTLLTREFKGQIHVVELLDGGFEYDGRIYKSLSALASEITGTRWNGFPFFGLTDAKEARVV